MVKLFLLSSFALLLLHQCASVSAGASNQIDPIQSSIYYLQDYCAVTESELEEKTRHRRSYNQDDDDVGLSNKIHQTVRDTKKKIKNQVERELEIRRKWKQVFLDLASPSVVVKLWRSDSNERNQQHHKLVDNAAIHQKVSCKLLLRLSNLNESSANQTIALLANSTLGAVVNFLKFNQKPWLNDYRLRIVSSDPNMTQYWLAGRKLNTASSNEPQLSLPVAVDLVSHPQMHPEPLTKEELELLHKANESGKWLLIELETINQAFMSNDEDESRRKASTIQKPQQQPQKDDTELVISMFTRSVRSAGVVLLGDSQSKSNAAQNGTLQCPVGTFDCAGDGEQCIPSGLRCNGEDNCGNRLEELLNCGTVNLYYIFDGTHHDEFDFESDGFWLAVRILVLLFLICLIMYITSLLCRCCCDRGRRGHQIINGRSPMVYHLRTAKNGLLGAEPLLAAGASGRMANSASGSSTGRPVSPPPSYFGNQLDNQKSNVNEYIYVNNHYNSNYGQPQGSTAVHTGVGVPVSLHGGNASAPPSFDNVASMYPKIDYPSYGSTHQQ